MEKHLVVKEHIANYTIGKLEPEDLLKFLNQHFYHKRSSKL